MGELECLSQSASQLPIHLSSGELLGHHIQECDISHPSESL